MALRSVLLSAALPGGRSEWSDPGFSDEHAQEPTLMDGLPRNAFELWERSNGPLGLNTHFVITHYNIWRRLVQDNVALQALMQRIPELKTIVAISS